MSLNQFDFINSVRRKYAGAKKPATSRFSGVLEGIERYRKSVADARSKREKDEALKKKEAEKAQAKQEQGGLGKMQSNFNSFVGSIVSNNPAANPVPNIPTQNPAKPNPMDKQAAVMDPLLVKHASVCENWSKLNDKLNAWITQKFAADNPQPSPSPNPAPNPEPQPPQDPKQKFDGMDYLQGMSAHPRQFKEELRKAYPNLDEESLSRKALYLMEKSQATTAGGVRNTIRKYAPAIIGVMGWTRTDLGGSPIPAMPVPQTRGYVGADPDLSSYKAFKMRYDALRNPEGGWWGGFNPYTSVQQRLPGGPGAWAR